MCINEKGRERKGKEEREGHSLTQCINFLVMSESIFNTYTHLNSQHQQQITDIIMGTVHVCLCTCKWGLIIMAAARSNVIKAVMFRHM